jgi:hypothetical protein
MVYVCNKRMNKRKQIGVVGIVKIIITAFYMAHYISL